MVLSCLYTRCSYATGAVFLQTRFREKTIYYKSFTIRARGDEIPGVERSVGGE